MGVQVVTSINFGMGEVGKERLKRYKELAGKRGYDSLSAFIVEVVDTDLGITDLPKPKGRRPAKQE